MRTQRHAVRLRERRHRRDVALQRVAIDHQHRRVERRARAVLADQMRGAIDIVDHAPPITPIPNSYARCAFANFAPGSTLRAHGAEPLAFG